MPLEKDANGPAGFNTPAPNIPVAPELGPDSQASKVSNILSSRPSEPIPPVDGEAKIALPNLADIEKSYAADNKLIEQCEDEALEALFGRQITGRLEDPQNAQTLAKLNELIDRFNTTSARLEKIERGCQLLSEGLIK